MMIMMKMMKRMISLGVRYFSMFQLCSIFMTVVFCLCSSYVLYVFWVYCLCFLFVTIALLLYSRYVSVGFCFRSHVPSMFRVLPFMFWLSSYYVLVIFQSPSGFVQPMFYLCHICVMLRIPSVYVPVMFSVTRRSRSDECY